MGISGDTPFFNNLHVMEPHRFKHGWIRASSTAQPPYLLVITSYVTLSFSSHLSSEYTSQCILHDTQLCIQVFVR